MADLSKVEAHFKKVDLIMYSAIKSTELGDIKAGKSEDYFSNLCREIVGQQLSGKVAKVIFGRFKELFPNGTVTPKNVLAVSDDDIRNVGMSWSKVGFIKDLAQKVEDRQLVLSTLVDLDDEQVTKALMKVKGIGSWTAEMFLIFTLGSEDVFSHGDLGLRKAIARMYDLDKPTREQIDKIASEWKPYRTYASLALWHSLDNLSKD